jgi:tRNA-Thr(GGU) m(6)t(6)A37 methyltransferase TsaA
MTDNTAPPFSHVLRPLGHIQTPFATLRAVPRQGGLAPAVRAQLVLDTSWVPAFALDGLELYSHVWVFFVFHLNVTSRKAGARTSIKTKIRPPKHDKKVGVFSTRSPHRPNPIGQTLALVEGIEISADGSRGVLTLTGVDLVDGTPVIDLKPYVPFYDSVPGAIVAPWTSKAFNANPLRVSFSNEAAEQLQQLLPCMKFYSSADDAAAAIREILSLDVRSGGARSRRQRPGREDDLAVQGDVGDDSGSNTTFCISFDGLDMSCDEDRTAAAVAVVDIRKSSSACRVENKNTTDATVLNDKIVEGKAMRGAMRREKLLAKGLLPLSSRNKKKGLQQHWLFKLAFILKRKGCHRWWSWAVALVLFAAFGRAWQRRIKRRRG